MASAKPYEANFTFKNGNYEHELKWTVKPDKCMYGDDGLKVFMNAKSDFWQKTYYNPPLLNDNGHILYKEISDEYIMLETHFDLQAGQQFDQAGLAVRLNTDRWIKCGLEYVDGRYRLGCVVTNTYSDWSVQDYPSGKLGLRLYRQGNDFIIEAKPPTSDKWDFIRICHLDVEKSAPLKMGLMACAPTAAGGNTTFNYLLFQENKGYHH